MIPHHSPGRHQRLFRFHTWAFVLALVPIVLLVVAACTEAGEPEALTTTPSDGSLAATSQSQTITIEEDGFQPESVELVEGTTVTFRNNTDSDISLVITGTGEDSDRVRQLAPGALIDVRLDAPGARILTIEDQPDVAGTVMVIPADDER